MTATASLWSAAPHTTAAATACRRVTIRRSPSLNIGDDAVPSQ
ncbi:hypothetical protein ACFWY6_07125 [Streptomyces sp. NPDC059037]